MNYLRAKLHLKLLLLFCVFFLYIPLSGQNDKKISINSANITIKEALKEVEKQSKMSVAYNESKLQSDQNISLNIKDQSVANAVATILSNTDFSYQLNDEHIMIISKGIEQSDKKKIKGKVLDEFGEPLAGATVAIRGTTQGTITDFDGNYTLDVSQGQTLVFSFLGYTPQNVVVKDQTTIDLQMEYSTKDLSTVVITALGIKREEKALSYNVQQVGQDELTRVKDANFMNSLTGKVAGLNINSSSSGVGGASKVVMRGTKSITQSSNALYVIDGVPMFDTMNDGGELEKGSRGATEGIADINPEDIESISVLNGAAAAALYGSYAANGAILVNTKKGAEGKAKITFSSNVDFSNPFVLPKFQNKYGTGNRGVGISRDGNQSWGELLNTENRMGYDPKSDFFRTGIMYNNSVSVSTGTEKNQTFFSAGAINSDGIVPENKYERYNFTVRNTTKFLNDKMTLDLSANYIIQKDQNMVNQGEYSNPIVSSYLYPRGNSWDQARVYELYDPARKIYTQNWEPGEGMFTMQNPYWIANRNLRNNFKKRYMLSAGLSYDILDWLNVAGRVRIDNDNNKYEKKMFASSPKTLTEGSNNGLYELTNSESRQTYADVLVNIDRRFNDFSLTTNIGASISDIRYDDIGTGGALDQELIPNVFNALNIAHTTRKTKQNYWKEQTQSVFASAELGWRSMYYLTLTARNDWASQLANSSSSSFFYPSVGLSTVLSEIFTLPKQIEYLKLRGSFSSVGTPYPRHLTSLRYGFNETNLSWELRTHYPIGDLKAERTDSWEIGLDARFLKNFTLDLTLYLANTRNQTFDPEISVSSGYKTMYVQSGYVRNKGIELAVSYSNKWNDIAWNSSFTFSANKNEIKTLVKDWVHPETGEIVNKDRLNIGGYNRARFILKEGGSMGDLYSISDLRRDSEGNIYIDENGKTSVVHNVEDIKLGNVLPKANLAWRNEISWKGITVSALVSARLGGVVYSATQAALDVYGVSKASADARDAGGVPINGGDMLSPETWYAGIGIDALPQYYTYSATNVRLQEASISYNIPKKWVNNIVDLTVSAVGRNLWMIHNRAPFDPESVASTGNYYQGIDYFIMPSSRTFGFNIRAKF